MIKEMTFDYIVDRKNRVVICQGIVPFIDTESGEKIFGVLDKGVARCREGDEFDEEFGKKLAQRKLLLKVNREQRKVIELQIASIRDNLQDVLKEYDVLNRELVRHLKKYDEILTLKYPRRKEETND